MPRKTKLILCPLNLRHAKIEYNAYSEAVDMARRRGAKLIIATVAPEIERNLNIYNSDIYWGEQLQEFLKAHPADDVEVETVVRKGAVHRQIVKLADDRNVDLIVMEAANPKVQDYLLGTTASHVVTHAECSVYVVRS
ncbi:universal stress protein [Roseovarius indicus]|jgi:universal stress protein F|uniref:Universal stress protein F n=1 Tax=Roseovarius indicus TaxID=540747 RepID=A0A0T5PE52_9RHOB|nr:universal stress protein [Roseovarius indicus]KRS19437.1 universal stress protein UspA [Roseovarius indicus]OAO03992.1 universal stress protein UspA [Roseovarius indicus]QEW29247.1 Universal stress protein F [Roseovarius indicus]SFD77312.1 Nucleotide-binding universal stress protein, UspA family [Roseovarius indicus]